MAEYLIQDTTLDDIADAINAKTGGSSAMTPDEMVEAIGSITGGAETMYWDSDLQYPYSENTETPLTVITSYSLRDSTHLKNFSAPNATSIRAGYFLYHTSVENISLPKASSITGARAFGYNTSLQTLTIGSIGYGLSVFSASSVFYGMSAVSFTANIFCTGGDVDSLLSIIRNNGGNNATVCFYASESTTYNNVSYNAGDLMLKSEVA